jgi:hypothetical protein
MDFAHSPRQGFDDDLAKKWRRSAPCLMQAKFRPASRFLLLLLAFLDVAVAASSL